ncbi:hypothetical protein ACWDWO_21835 [Actinopolymorpha singaporensis]|uniref:Uncharacterized protein n=1 Tax=Actinopolymorpha singaporensis TaxID=117157 RepID=A0A1H1PGE6_9ACTN|nr:hypothetical protein [Actinopolymorpha singaporensis]SDS10160.1 hypothetical protein SAMN04489717_1629 [Actinopolymorpha singaporensis]
MQIQKSQVVDLLKQHGQADKAQAVEQHLPDTIDTDQHADLLKKHGVDPSQLTEGGLGGAAKDIGGKLGL